MVINKEGCTLCSAGGLLPERGLEILARIPYDPELAALAADGKLIWGEAGAREIFSGLLQKIGGGMKRLLILSGKGDRKDHHCRCLHPVCPCPSGG